MVNAVTTAIKLTEDIDRAKSAVGSPRSGLPRTRGYGLAEMLEWLVEEKVSNRKFCHRQSERSAGKTF